MVIQFKSIRLYNFCSYADSEISLINKGFCLVSGRNKCKKDNALSNGSGKSTIWSAICYALTGETLTGVKNNLKNINNNDTDCFVTLSFYVDSDQYAVTRYYAPKSDLKIFKNGADISGKGIRESERILSENIPDLTKDLLASTILLGQGMPNKFSSFNPSGRKDLLEKLTKSDFMIDDIKERISNRLQALNTQLREYEDCLLVNNTQLSTLKLSLTSAKQELNNMVSEDYTIVIPKSEARINELAAKLSTLDAQIKSTEAEIERLNTRIILLTTEKSKCSEQEFASYNAAYAKENEKKIQASAAIVALEKEIKKLKAIKDVCPTCGQKLRDVVKPSTAEQENSVKKYNEIIAAVDLRLQEISEKHKSYVEEINANYSEVDALQGSLHENKNTLMNTKNVFNSLNCEFTAEKAHLSKLLYDKENTERIYNSAKNKVNDYEKSIQQLENTVRLTDVARLQVEERVNTVKKIESLVKRDFRGYLLYNIIEYLNTKAKEYSKIVFDCDELNIYLDGNALDISYCGKLYESLSGGEKQRVDLITQFAIRELLQKYFNYSSNILVLDEITDNLDKLATNKIFDLITDKLKDVESVFIISHHDESLEIPIDSELQVIKDENSISNIKEN